MLLAPRAQRSGPFEKGRKEGEEGGAKGTAISISSPSPYPRALLLPPALPPSTPLLLSFCFAHCPKEEEEESQEGDHRAGTRKETRKRKIKGGFQRLTDDQQRNISDRNKQPDHKLLEDSRQSAREAKWELPLSPHAQLEHHTAQGLRIAANDRGRQSLHTWVATHGYVNDGIDDTSKMKLSDTLVTNRDNAPIYKKRRSQLC